MLLEILSISLSLFDAIVAAQSVVCIPGQCLEGFTNTTFGISVSSAGLPASLLLLPGSYTSTTNPQFLHQALTSSSSTFTTSPGFTNSSTTLPIDVALQPGIALFPETLYSGSYAFDSFPVSNSTSQVAVSSIALSTNIWAAISSASARTIIWDSVPDISQLPSDLSLPLTVLDIQSSACSPSCSSGGVCSPTNNSCACAPGFTGASCESCLPNFFGANCSACPSDCLQCDDSITGTGRCLRPKPSPSAPTNCNCLNGQCGSNGQCTCNTGWTTAENGTSCAKCQDGFFEDSTGDCKVCTIGCTSCASITGNCLACASGFTQSQNDPTQCIPQQSVTSGGPVCPDGSFSSGTECNACDPACAKCNGPTSNDCTLCATGTYSFNGSCVKADDNGVCEGSGRIADNNKRECDACGAKCTACGIPGFSIASTVSELQCTACLSGSFLSNGTCVDACPSGTFVDPKDNSTCTPCDASCGTCAGSSTFCLSCPAGSNQLASDGSCISSCPSGTFSSSGACIPCHPDCESCSGSAFSQCLSCPASRPALSDGRCLPTCAKNQFFDPSSESCQTCDSSCASCSGNGPGQCLSCSSPTNVLRSGACVEAQCTQNTTVIPGLGVCLSDIVSTTTGSPLPAIPGLSDPTTVVTQTRPLQWWEILLMVLGCVFIFLVVVMCWRRRMRKKRQDKTKKWATAKRLPGMADWKWRLVRLGERFFGHHPSTRVEVQNQERDLEQGRTLETYTKRPSLDVEKLIAEYQYPRDSNRDEPESSRGNYRLEPTKTGDTSNSRNPFNSL